MIAKQETHLSAVIGRGVDQKYPYFFSAFICGIRPAGLQRSKCVLIQVGCLRVHIYHVYIYIIETYYNLYIHTCTHMCVYIYICIDMVIHFFFHQFDRAWRTTKLTLPSFSIRRTKGSGAVAHGTTHVVWWNAAPTPWRRGKWQGVLTVITYECDYIGIVDIKFDLISSLSQLTISLL